MKFKLIFCTFHLHISPCPLLKPCVPPGPCLLLCFIFFLPLSYQGLLSCFRFPSMPIFLGVLSLDLFHLKHSPWAVLPTIVLMTPISMFLTKFSRVCLHASECVNTLSEWHLKCPIFKTPFCSSELLLLHFSLFGNHSSSHPTLETS